MSRMTWLAEARPAYPPPLATNEELFPKSLLPSQITRAVGKIVGPFLAKEPVIVPQGIGFSMLFNLEQGDDGGPDG